MNSQRYHRLALAALICSALGNAHAASFVYEGRLDDLGQPANGRYDLRLSAYGDAAQGATLAAPITFEGVEVKEGRFRLDVELPLVHANQVWLEVAVRGSSEPSFSAIPGRSKAIAAPLIGACWSTTGDFGVNAATNFIGTTDAQPFVVRTANARSLRIEPSTILFGGLPITSNTIGGSRSNAVAAGVRGATIAGGGVPSGDSDPDFLSESPNRVTDHYGTVGGGFFNRAGDDSGATDRPFATVGGGRENTASGGSSTVGGGIGNTASGSFSTVGGGNSNTASGISSTVGGGENNFASGADSTVAGGQFNCAGAHWSWAGGFRAKIRPGTDPGGTGSCSSLTYPGGNGDQGTFVWADSQAASVVSTGDNQFLVRAGGGIYFGTNSTVSIPAGRFINTSTGAFLTTGGTWTNASSRSYKENFTTVNGLDVLSRLVAMPIMTWDYIGSGEGLHMGPVAEDFKASFGLAGDGKSISTVDADGVALAAIQGLNAKLEAENAALRARLDALEARLQ